MTLEEAKRIADVIRRADGGCSVCVENLCEAMTAAFPEFVFTLSEERQPRPEDDAPQEVWDNWCDTLVTVEEAKP